MAGTAQEAFAPPGILALRPEAFGAFFGAPAPAKPALVEGVATVAIRGPLMQHQHWLFDSYDAIVARVADALALAPERLVLAVDSPGGVVAGCFDAAAQIRAMADAAGVPIQAHVDGLAASAGYALASVADEIVASSTAQVGSVGVIAGLVDYTAMNTAYGLRVEMVATGGRKTDGNPNVPITKDAIAAAQTRIDAMGAIFFAHVAEHRGMGQAQVKALDAAIFVGAAAVAAGLVDRIAPMSALATSTVAGANARASSAQETAMNEEQRKAMAAALGLAPEATSDDITREAAAKTAALATTQEHLALEQAKVAQAEAAAAAAAKSGREERVEQLVASGLAAGKIPPVLLAEYRELCSTDAGLKTVTAMIAKAPSLVADDTDVDPETGPADGLTASEMKIADDLGVSHADYLKTKNGGR